MAPKHWVLVQYVCAILILNLPLSTTGKSRVCTYFGGDRSPKEAYSLSNCTWYRESACCERTEVASVFSEMPALLTNVKGCYDRMNYLMCYFCSPDQSLWYNRTLSICESYCHEIFSYCGSAKHNGQSISSKYEDGLSFCKAQAYSVFRNPSENELRCLKFDPTPFGGGRRNDLQQWMFLLFVIINVYINYAN